MKSKIIDQNLSARQLLKDEYLSDMQYKEIACLIYGTDELIFPALFEGNEDTKKAAEDAISYVLKMGTDNMYNKENLFVCFEGSAVIGMILWCYKTMKWDYEGFIRSAVKSGVNLLQENVVAINKAFFGENEISDQNNTSNLIVLINVCVNPSFRENGVGTFMLNKFVQLYKEYNMELCVLKNNTTALNLYKANGFRITSEYPGFSQTTEKPMCYGMQRDALILNSEAEGGKCYEQF